MLQKLLAYCSYFLSLVLTLVREFCEHTLYMVVYLNKSLVFIIYSPSSYALILNIWCLDGRLFVFNSFLFGFLASLWMEKPAGAVSVGS